MKDLERIFRALADETRLCMLALMIKRGELCVCDFMTVLGITQSKASRHLRYLANAGLVCDRRDGVWVLYRLRPDPPSDVERIVSMLRDLFANRQLGPILDRLDKWVEERKHSPKNLRSFAKNQSGEEP